MAHAHPAGPVEYWALALMWFTMMAAMMGPTVTPWILAFHRFSRAGTGSSVAATSQFAAGYLTAWFTYSLAAAGAQQALARIDVLEQAATGGVIFLLAGLYQFVAPKVACLTHCRSPLSYFLTRWRDGPASGFQLGVRHGLFCVGCCWALMATALALGAMNAWWMGALAIVSLVEQVAPHGHLLRRPLGLGLLATGVWFMS